MSNAPMFNMGYGSGQTLHRDESRMQISKFVIFETPEFDAQYRRPFVAAMTGDVMQALSESVDPQQGIGASGMAGIANRFIKPQAQPESSSPILIPNGWNTRRCRFLMEVIRPTPLGRTITMVMGYTEHSEYSLSGRLDDRMSFVVNSVASIRESNHHTPTGNHTFRNIHDNCQVLVDNEWGGVGAGSHDYSIRPQDVMSIISRQNLRAIPDWHQQAVDVRNVVRNVPMLSNRLNNSATHYAANIIDSYQSARELTQLGGSYDSILGQARGSVAEPSSAMNDFLMAIANIRGESMATNFFTIRDLRMLDPGVDMKCHFRRIGTAPVMAGNWATHGSTQGWAGADFHTQFAAIISQAIPAIMVELGITEYGFVGTNRTLNSRSMCTTFHYQTFSNMDMSNALAKLETRVATEVLRDVSCMDQLDYEVRAQIDLLGETNMFISIGGGEAVPFRCPSFCDSLFTPVVTRNFSQAEDVAGAFSTIFNEVMPDEPSFGQTGYNHNMPSFVGKL